MASRLRTIFTVELRLLRREQLLDDSSGEFTNIGQPIVMDGCEAMTYSENEATRMYNGNEDDVGANEGECISPKNAACEHGRRDTCSKCGEHDPKACGCEYRGSGMWSCGHKDNQD